MAKIMAVNAGSSSIKFQLLEMPSEEVIASGIMEKIGTKINGENVPGIFTIKYNGKKEEANPVLVDHAVGVELLLNALVEKGIVAKLDEITGVGHRVVQGGEFFKDSCLVDEEVVEKILDLASLAPLHNKAHVVGIKAFQKALPSVPQVVVFDTTFHQTMTPEAYMYATPYEWYEKYGIRMDANTYNGPVTIKDCEVSAFIPVVVRNANASAYKLKFEGTNTMTASNTDGYWCAIGTSEYEKNGELPTDATGVVTVTLNDLGLAATGVYGASNL